MSAWEGSAWQEQQEARDEIARRSAPKPRHTDAEIRRLYEPAPSTELRAAAADAVSYVFLEELCQRLDAIAEVAKELGGAVGEQIRQLAGVGTAYTFEKGTETRTRLTASHDLRGGVVFARSEEGDSAPVEGRPTLVDFVDRVKEDGPDRSELREVTRTGEVLER